MPNLEKAGIDVPDVSREENWLPIKDFEGLYEVSDLGRVRSVDRWVPHGVGNRYGIGPDGRMRFRRGRVIRQGTIHSGHKTLTLSRMGIHYQRSVHTLVKHTFDAPQPEGKIVCHDNGDPSDNRLENLYWGTYEQNALDKERHGTNHQLNKDRCPYDHPYAGANLIATMGNVTVSGPGPLRECRACENTHQRFRNWKKRGIHLPDFKETADAQYKKIMGRAPVPRVKLTHADVAEILELISAGRNNTDIGRKFGIAGNTVLQIRRGQHWTQKTNLEVPAPRPAVVDTQGVR